ncbi:MAG TPA: protein translocase subunit SecF [Dehalococcoidales bacterium]|nr:protein translocase subunit SecF [Dehalococcoidales bacterium]
MNIVNKRRYYFIVGGALALISIICLLVLGLNLGIDFQAGTEMTIGFEQQVLKEDLRAEMRNLGFPEAAVSLSSAGHFFIQTRELTLAETQQVEASLEAKFGALNISYESVPQNIAVESIRNAAIAVVIAVIGMMIYIAIAFRKMPNPFKFGVCAVAGLSLDVLITLGVFAILGQILNWSIDLMFVAGILAVLGYSINNTIIVFDRIRENTARGISTDFEVVANASIVETLARSFNSIISTLITLFVLLLFVGSAIQNFVIVLIIGCISGAVSATFLSPELLVSWMKKKGAVSDTPAKVKA